MDDLGLLEPFVRMLAEVCSPAVIRAIAAGGDAASLWQQLDESGFLDALVPEAAGGAGLDLKAVAPLLMACGRFALPVPVGDTMVARALLADAGLDRPAGAIALRGAGLVVPKRALHYLGDGPSLHPDGGPAGPDLRALGALIQATRIAGAADRLLEMTVGYANERRQFGKSIGKQQAVQQQVAIMAEEVVATRMAAQIGCAGGLRPGLAAAIAKQRASAAAAVIADIAHAVHGAIGISEEFDLQIYTGVMRESRLAYGSESYWALRIGQARLADAGRSSVDFLCAELAEPAL